MKIYLISAAGVIFLSVIVSLLIPEGKLSKTILFVMKLACIIVLLQPIKGLFKINKTESDEPLSDYTYICGVYSDELSRQYGDALTKKFGFECNSEVKVGFNEGKFKVETVSVEINSQDENKIEEIYEYLRKEGYINITVYAKGH